MSLHLPGIGFSDMQGEMADLAEKFCAQKSPMDRVRTLLDSPQGYSEAVWSEMAALGLCGIGIDDKYGGSALGLGEIVPIVEHMGRTLMAGPYMDTVLAAHIISALADVPQKQAYLPQICAGRTWALAVEATHSTDARILSQEGTLVLSGQKRLVAFADSADFILLSAQYEDAPVLVIVPRSDIHHSHLRRENIIDETMRCYDLNLAGIKVDKQAIITHDDMPAAMDDLHLAANLLNTALMVGGTKAVIDLTIDYANTRSQFGRPIGAYQAVKHPLVDAWIDYEKAKGLLYSAAHNVNKDGAKIAIPMARVKAETAFAFAADRAIQFHGATGFTHECDAGLYRRRALFCASRYGDAHHHKQKLADLLLG